MNQLQRLTRDDVAIMRWVAQNMIDSKMLPASIDKPEKAIAILMMARELNVPDWQAVNQINVIHGKPTVSPQLMIALIERSGLLEDMIVESGEGFCSVTMKRFGRTAHKETFTMEHAQKMGLAGKHNWKVQPETMLKWRAVSACARVAFPHVISGLYTPEEINPDLVVDSDGKIEVTASTYVPQEEKASNSTQAIEAPEAEEPEIEEEKIIQMPKQVEAKKEEPASRTKSEPVPETKKPEKWTDQQRKIVFARLSEKRPSKTDEEKKAYLRQLAMVESCNDILKAQVDQILATIWKLPPEEKPSVEASKNPEPEESPLSRLEEEIMVVKELEDDDPVNLEQLKVLLEVATSQNKKALAKSITKKVEGEEKVSKALWKSWVEKINMGEAPK